VSAFVINSYAFGGEDPDAAAYLNAVESADTQALEAAVRKAVDDFVKGLKADGIWSAIKASCILAGARTLSGALTPLVGSAPTNVGGNFVSGDYDRETGLKGNGGNKYLDSNRNNNADPQNSHHLAVWATEAQTPSSVGARFAGYGSGTDGRTTIGHATGVLLNSRSRSNTLTQHATAYAVPTLLGISRASSSAYTFIRNNSTGSVSVNSQTPASGNIEIFRANTDPTTARFSFYSIGESLSLTDLHARVSTLMTDLDAAI